LPIAVECALLGRSWRNGPVKDASRSRRIVAWALFLHRFPRELDTPFRE
jgi:hypothetical protein